MNTQATRIAVVASVAVLAAALSLAVVPHDASRNAPAATGDPSLPSASEALQTRTPKPAEGNVQDMTY
jgi:hypothetical protein